MRHYCRVEEVTLGRAHHRVSFGILGKEFPTELDNDDAQWLRVNIDVIVGGRRASIREATLTIGEFTSFLEDLERLVAGSKRIARLDSMEEWIELVLDMNSRGGLEVRGRVLDAPGLGNSLEFTLEDLDQTYLPPLVDELRAALSPYL